MSQAQVSKILDRISAAYTGCTSYRDCGKVTSVIIKGTGATDRHTRALEFETAFVRPNLFRFEYCEVDVGPRSEWSRYVVWQSGTRIRSWWTLKNQVNEFDSRRRALAGPTGVSLGTAALIPPLLEKRNSRTRLGIRCATAVYKGIEKVNGFDCHKIEEPEPNQLCRREILWVDSETHLILRVDVESEFDVEQQKHSREQSLILARLRAEEDAVSARLLKQLEKQPLSVESFRTEQTTLYHPELNCEIARKAFDFEPPDDSECGR